MSSGLKRPSNTPSSPRKKPRPQYKTLKSLVEEAAKEVDDVIEHVKEEILPLLQRLNLDTLGVERAMSAMGCVVRAASAPGEKKLGEMRYLEVRIDIPDDYPDLEKLPLNDLNTQYANLASYFRVLLNSLPAPSEFAKTDVWADVQRTRAAILCMRPVEKSGVPICTLHDVFHLFRIQLSTDLSPATDDPIAVASIRAAAMLCNEMGDSFEDENARTATFNHCVRELLPNVEVNHVFNPSQDIASCRVDAVWFAGSNKLPVCLHKDKCEAGDTGCDIYMEVARIYSLVVKTLMDSASMNDWYLKEGAPMLLLCLLGTHLSVQGGFYDGERYIVEPLSAMYSMLPDATKGRQNQLAWLLYAVAKGVDELKELASSTTKPPSFPPATPRIYSSSFTLYAETAADTSADKPSTGTLPFKARLAAPHSNKMLFTAMLSMTSAWGELLEQIPVVVKLVSGSRDFSQLS